MKRIVLLLLAGFIVVGFGCGRKKSQITSLQRKQAAAMVSEAEFAVTIRDLPRAEKLLREATALCPDDGSYWLNLGATCRKANHTADAKKAYERALAAYEDAYDATPTDSALLMRQMYTNALLGRIDEVRAIMKKARKRHPNDTQVSGFDETALTRMLADPAFKEMAL